MFVPFVQDQDFEIPQEFMLSAKEQTAKIPTMTILRKKEKYLKFMKTKYFKAQEEYFQAIRDKKLSINDNVFCKEKKMQKLGKFIYKLKADVIKIMEILKIEIPDYYFTSF